MSIRVMSQVWSKSRAKGSTLILLLAIADFADDNGYAYPSIGVLAEKCRMSERNTQYAVMALVKSGELLVKRNGGMRGANLYRVMVERNLSLFDPSAPYGRCADCGFAPETDGEIDRHHIVEKADGGSDDASNLVDLCKSCHPKRHRQTGAKFAGANFSDEAGFVRGVQPKVKRGATAIAPEPSVTTKEPPSVKRASAHHTRPGADYEPTPAVREWVKANGYEPYLQLHIEKFRDTCATQARKAYKPDGLDAAFRNCVRDDWGNVRRQAKDAERRGERPTGAPAKNWWEDARQIDERARKLGMDWGGPNVEKYPAFALRVRAEFERRERLKNSLARFPNEEERAPA